LVYGNTQIENEGITWDIVVRADEKVAGAAHGSSRGR
jgi:hypothetical protein